MFDISFKKVTSLSIAFDEAISCAIADPMVGQATCCVWSSVGGHGCGEGHRRPRHRPE